MSIGRPPRRVFVYVDGFNLYHRRLENDPPSKWLCLRKLASEFLFEHDNVEVIKFFTARVDPFADPTKPTPKQQRQATYWKALESRGVEIIKGELAPRQRRCKAGACGRFLTFETMSEKMSDVNLALHVYRDYIEKQPDVICVISADIDVLPALKMIRERAGNGDFPRVLIYIFLPIQDNDLLQSRKPEHCRIAITRQLSNLHVSKSRLPDIVQLPDGTSVQCPDVWLPVQKQGLLSTGSP
ncbi:MAG TPA: NYN domain-containing protein [Opitutaceae bacterium]|nr:NYN domain-containing protein [Opitutaceae bacterium]